MSYRDTVITLLTNVITMTRIVSLTNNELRRLEIINQLIRNHINATQAAEMLYISTRQVKRLKAKVIKDGSKAIAHAGRGKISNFKISCGERELIVNLIKEHYSDFGPTFATEKLAENHNIIRDPKTIRAIMVEEKIWASQRKKKSIVAHRSWRLRRANYGELVQFDGSYHHWFEDRNRTGELCLLAAIDDATGCIIHATFDAHEGVFPVFTFWHQYLLQVGKPISIYLDKFSTYKMNHKVATENHELKTQFQRAMTELRIEPIFANSPQAKGRVEKLFKTLQDRLIKELRLQNISDIESANKFLTKKFIPAFNKRFAVTARNPANLHRALSEKEKAVLPAILSRQTVRTVQNDFTISFNSQWYQLLSNQPVTVCKRDKIIVEERTDQTIHFCLRNKYLNVKPIPKALKPIQEKSQLWVIPATGQTDQTDK